MGTDVWVSTIERVREAAESHLGGQAGNAEAALRAIDQEALTREFEDALGRVQGIPGAAAPVRLARRPARGITPRNQVEIFHRDRFTCRYCGRWTLFLPTLRALSILYPEALPYQETWKFEATHHVYWTHPASCDHIEPVAHGGTSEPDNLATVCHLCNHAKGKARLEDLGWQLQPPATRYWDGLSGLYSRLCLASPVIRESGDLGKWRRALDESEQRVVQSTYSR